MIYELILIAMVAGNPNPAVEKIDDYNTRRNCEYARDLAYEVPVPKEITKRELVCQVSKTKTRKVYIPYS